MQATLVTSTTPVSSEGNHDHAKTKPVTLWGYFQKHCAPLKSFPQSVEERGGEAQGSDKTQPGSSVLHDPMTSTTDAVASSSSQSPPVSLPLSPKKHELLHSLLPLPNDGLKLTRSQRLFSVVTGIPFQSLSINDRDEFFLFMDMRAELGWASFNMNSARYAQATLEYNTRLESANKTKGRGTVKKSPRAIMEKLVDVEDVIMVRLSTNNFVCKFDTSHLLLIHHSDPLTILLLAKRSGTDTFWRRHCHAVPLGKAIMEPTQNSNGSSVCTLLHSATRTHN